MENTTTPTKAWDLVQTPDAFHTISASGTVNNDGVRLSFDAYFTTTTEAAEVAATFPKGCKVRVSTLSGVGPDRAITLAFITTDVALISNGSTGEVNETGVRRLRQIIKAIDAKGLTVDWRRTCSNAVGSWAEVLEMAR